MRCRRLPELLKVRHDAICATIARILSEEAGYTVGMFGKYLNNVPNYVPVGFDAWLANGGGDYIAPAFSTFNAGPGIPDGHWHGTADNYTTAVVGNLSIHFIRQAVAARGEQHAQAEVEARQSWIRAAAVLGAVAPWVILGLLALRG